jgi:hypothetical protein
MKLLNLLHLPECKDVTEHQHHQVNVITQILEKEVDIKVFAIRGMKLCSI